MNGLALVALVLAAALAVLAWWMDDKTSFEGGTFTVEIIVILAAIILFTSGVAILVISLFTSLP
jgi:hypothetical protein